jgi:hypothetical protein
MAQNITLLGANYPDVPAVTLPITGGGTATFSDTRSVTYNLTSGATASVNPSEAVTGQGFSVKLKAPAGYELSNVSITMGGVDITSQVFTPDEQGGGGGGGGTYVRTEILAQQTITPDSSQRRATLTGLTEGFVDGDYYIVTYDGVEWLTTCETLWTSNYTIGESQWFLGTGDYVYPFGIIWMSGTTATVAAANTSQHTVKIEHLEFVEDGVNLGTKTITQNGTYSASSDSLDGFSSVTVNCSGGTPTLQTKSVSYTPTTSAQSAQVTADSGYDGLDAVNVSVGAIPSEYIVPTGTKSITANGTGIDVKAYEKVDVAVPTGSSKNTQVVQGTTRTTSSSMTAIGAEMTVSKTGTYDVYWSAFRSSTSGSYTYATQLYIDNVAYGSEDSTWSNHVQNNHLSNVSLTANQNSESEGVTLVARHITSMHRH